jgi:hypothetical protein
MTGSITLAELLAEVNNTPVTTSSLIEVMKNNMEKPRYGWQVILHQNSANSILKRLERLEKIEKLIEEGRS